MASFVLSFFPLGVLDGIWDLIESVSEGFLTYSYLNEIICTFAISSLICRSIHISSNLAISTDVHEVGNKHLSF